MVTSPKVSIIVPTHNSERTLARCLESIRNQTYKNIELIVTDELSKDRTVETARQLYGSVFAERVDDKDFAGNPLGAQKRGAERILRVE